jgi:hypothetical protein
VNEDCYFEIGHSHTICEDYALTGKINDCLSYAIVCDGCSSSDIVDVGARILAHCAKEYLCAFYSQCKEIPNDIDAYVLGLSIVTRAAPHVKVLMLPNTSLDATLIITLASKGRTVTYFYGDGCLLYKENGVISYKEVNFPSGAPFYLSYLLDPERESIYHSQIGLEAVKIHYKVKGEELIEAEQEKLKDLPPEIFYKNIMINGAVDVEWVITMSDGIKTYQTKDEFGIQKESPFIDSIKSLSNYKGFAGKFVERRMRRMKKDCEKQGITHYDDISVATIYMGESNEKFS